MTEADERNLRRAVELAVEARAAGDMPFGSLLAGPDGDVLAEDRNTVLTEHDITAHPELKLARAGAIERIEPGIDPGDADVLDVAGRLVLPGLVDAHSHLDKTAEHGIDAEWRGERIRHG